MAAAFRALPDVDLSGDIWTSPVALGPEDGSLRHGSFSNGMTYAELTIISIYFTQYTQHSYPPCLLLFCYAWKLLSA
jgi:hypothetical protein